MPARSPRFRVRRIYDRPGADDGARVLVDRLWPRGISRARFDAEWLPAVAPSRALRRWYGHRAARRDEFLARYRVELAASPAAEAFATLRARAREAGRVTLLTATREAERTHAVALLRLLARRR